jgi:Uma2 family endonuclease
MMAVQKKLYTTDEFEAFIALPQHRERLFELIQGEIVEKVPTQLHGVIAAKTTIRLGGFVEQHGLGHVAVEVRHQLPGDEHNARLPDIAFYADVTIPLVEQGAVPRMPDLAIEIQSPDDSLQEMSEKADYYLANGCRMGWVDVYEKTVDRSAYSG